MIARGGAGVVISSQSGHRLGALIAEQDAALATTPAEQLLSLHHEERPDHNLDQPPVMGFGRPCRSPLMNRLVRQELFDEQRRSRRGEPDAPATLRLIAR